ncbi:MAG TPA: response regulator [Pseudomonadales bacterium]
MSAALAGADDRVSAALASPARRNAANAASMVQPLALVVDDSPFLALHLARQLDECGFHTQVPADAAELRALAPQAALVCVELEQFHASGFELTRELAEQCACPLVLLTGTGRNTDLQWGRRAGASVVLQRPIRAAMLRAALAALHDGASAR